MAAVAFGSLHYAHQLEAAGMPREQAEVVAQGLTAMFVHNFEGLPRFIGYSLVTKDYLDTRFGEQSGKMEFLAVDMDRKLDMLGTRLDNRIDLLSAEIDGKFCKLYIMFGVIMVGLAVPVIQTLVTWLA